MRRSNQSTIDAAFRESAHVRYRDLPPLPHWLVVTRWLRELNRKLDGPDTVKLYVHQAGWPDARWWADGSKHDWPGSDHSEELPGDGRPFDAPAAARRLLSEARTAGFR